jgi:hypothetical protein
VTPSATAKPRVKPQPLPNPGLQCALGDGTTGKPGIAGCWG